jgi:hypothetical protein
MKKTKSKDTLRNVGDQFKYLLNPRAAKLEKTFRIVHPISFMGIGFGASGISTFKEQSMITICIVTAIVSFAIPIILFSLARKRRKFEDEYCEHHESIISKKVQDALLKYNIMDFNPARLYLNFIQNGDYKELFLISYSRYESNNYQHPLSFGVDGDDIFQYASM